MIICTRYQEKKEADDSNVISSSPFNWDYPEFESPSGVYLLGDDVNVAIPIESIPDQCWNQPQMML